jgi:hypothetical protein
MYKAVEQFKFEYEGKTVFPLPHPSHIMRSGKEAWWNEITNAVRRELEIQKMYV